MRTQVVMKLMIVSTLTLGLILASIVGVSLNYADSEQTINPILSPNADIVLFNNTPPVIDGSLESYVGEWENATMQTTTFGVGASRITVTIRVQVNTTHLFMGISYVSEIYIPINTSIPYFNDSHTWYAVVLDQNFDEMIGYDNTTIDDSVVINYREEGARDAYFNGTTVNSLVLDLNNSGVENAIAAVGTELDDFNNYEVTIEFAKELDSGDINGNDIFLHEGEPLRYKLIVFQNTTGIYNHTLLPNKTTYWKTFKLETTYDYFSYVEDLSKINVLTYASAGKSTTEFNYTSFSRILEAYGMNSTYKTQSDVFVFTANGLEDVDLLILVGSCDGLTADEIDVLRYYVASGGSIYIFGDSTREFTKVNNILAHFGMEFYNATVFSEDLGVNSTLDFDASDIVDLPYFNDASILTDQSVNNIVYQGSAINFTFNQSGNSVGELKIQFQQGDLYPTIEKTGEYFVDLNDNGVFDIGEDMDKLNESIVVQATVELQRGGKLIATASADILNSSYINKADIRYLALKQVSWLLNLQHLISFDNFIVHESEVSFNENISVEISIEGDNNSIINDVHVWVAVQELHSDLVVFDLITLDNTYYNGSVLPEGVRANFVDVSIRMHKRGYGYNETSQFEVFVQENVDLSIKLDTIALIIFIASLGLAVIGGLATKRYQKKVEE